MTRSVIDALCRMPLAFKDAGDTTMGALFIVSRYRGDPPISEADVEAHLRKHPDLVDAWIAYSEDQRALPAWYLMRPRAGSTEEWRVDYLTRNEQPREEPFADEFAACAFFIIRKVDELSRLTGDQ